VAQETTIYGSIDRAILEQFAGIKLLACDVDGVFSDGRIYLGNQGEELKAFHTRDGYGIKAIQSIGIQVAVVTGRRSNIVEGRMQSLGVQHIEQGCEDKSEALRHLQEKLSISPVETASVGDDMPDLGMFASSELRIAVADAHPLVQAQANYLTQMRGGFGAVREICDLILHANNKLYDIYGSST
jgi:3-deoxy-D-manno-octulosonate 8-phosphate phosphatase (KDO 8-P phosphatase)